MHNLSPFHYTLFYVAYIYGNELLMGLGIFPDDIMKTRNQPKIQKRELLNPL